MDERPSARDVASHHIGRTFLAEVALAFVVITFFVSAGEDWVAFAELATRYEWPASKEFAEIFAPGLAEHVQPITMGAVALAILSLGWTDDAPWGALFLTVTALALGLIVLKEGRPRADSIRGCGGGDSDLQF
jgi:hypothetical protein